MKGIEIKEKLVKSGYKLADIAKSMNVSPQNLHGSLSTEDVKIGVLEKIANAIDKDITFFFENKSNNLSEIEVINGIVNNRRQIGYLYQRIVDVCVLNKDYLKLISAVDYDAVVQTAADITNKYNIHNLVKSDDGQIMEFWKSVSLPERMQYFSEGKESIRLLQEIFFEQFKFLYDNMRGFDKL